MSIMQNSLPDELRRSRAYTPPLARATRERSGATQEQVGRSVGVTALTVWRWENGHRWPRGELRHRYFDLLDDLAASS